MVYLAQDSRNVFLPACPFFTPLPPLLHSLSSLPRLLALPSAAIATGVMKGCRWTREKKKVWGKNEIIRLTAQQSAHVFLPVFLSSFLSFMMLVIFCSANSNTVESRKFKPWRQACALHWCFLHLLHTTVQKKKNLLLQNIAKTSATLICFSVAFSQPRFTTACCYINSAVLHACINNVFTHIHTR